MKDFFEETEREFYAKVKESKKMLSKEDVSDNETDVIPVNISPNKKRNDPGNSENQPSADPQILKTVKGVEVTTKSEIENESILIKNIPTEGNEGVSVEKEKEFKNFINKALEHLKFQKFNNTENTIEETMSYFKKKKETMFAVDDNLKFSWAKERIKGEPPEPVPTESKLVNSGPKKAVRMEAVKVVKTEIDTSKIRVIKLEKQEMDDFVKCSKKKEIAPSQDQKNKDIFLVGMERFDLCRDIFWKMRRAKETQAELTKEIAKHLNKDVEREHSSAVADSSNWVNKEIFGKVWFDEMDGV